MKFQQFVIAVCLGGAFSVAAGEDAHHLEGDAKAPATQAASAAKPRAPAMGMGMEHMQGRMKEMRAEMAAIRGTTDPAEKQRLMEAHMRTMESSMGMMDKMMGEGTPGPKEGDHEQHH